MELKDFISSSIEQIALGIMEASAKCETFDVIVNPNITIGSDSDYCIPKNPERINITRRVQMIEMDIAVNITESEHNTMGAKIGVSMFGVNGETKGGKNTSNESRIKFSIPVCLPIKNIIG